MILRRIKALQSGIALLLTSFVFGCASPGLPVRTQVPAPSRPSPEALEYKAPIDPVSVEKRIQNLQATLAREDLLENDRRREAMDLLGDYLIILQELRAPGATPPGDRSTAAILFDRLGALEARYFEKALDSTLPPTTTVLITAPKEKRIREAYISGDYTGVIQACLDHEKLYGPESLTPETELIFAMALAESGRTREAIRVGERVISALHGGPDLLHLRSSMVAWYQDQGNFKMAREHYEKLLDDMRERSAQLDLAQRRLEPSVVYMHPERHPAPPREAPVESFPPGPLGDLLHRVETLIRAGSFDQARFLLIRQRIRYSEGTETAAIDRAMERIDRAESATRRTAPEPHTQPDPDEAVDHVLDQARELFEGEDYEKALSKLDELHGIADSKDPRIDTLRQRAESEIVRSGRERAAKLFLIARNTQNAKEKETHLRASHGLLRELLERFPESSMAPTIRNNLSIVEEEMERAGLPMAGRQRRE